MMNMSGFRHWLIVPTRTEAAPPARDTLLCDLLVGGSGVPKLA